MKCSKCHAELNEGELFCPECGTKVEPAEQPEASAPSEEKGDFCPNCGKPLAPGAVFCESCGARTDGGETAAGEKTETSDGEKAEAPAAAPGKKPKTTLIVGGVAAAAVIVAVGGFALSRAGGTSAGASNGIPSEVIYVKDGGILGMNLKKLDADPVEYTDNFFDGDQNPLSGVTRSTMPMATKDGKYHFVLKKYSAQDGCFDLYYQKGKDDAEKIAGNVKNYKVTDQNVLVYLKDGALYAGAIGEDAEKAVSDVKDFWLSKDGKKLIWSESDGGENGSAADFYCQDLNLEGKKEKLASGSTMNTHSDNFDNILFLKDGDLYQSKDYAKADKLAEDVQNIMSVDLEKGTFFYTVAGEKKAMASDYVVDDMAEADAQVTEPNKADYETEVSNGWFSYSKVSDQYYEDREKYEEKRDRDALRQELAETEITDRYTELYYYAEGTGNLITSDFVDFRASTNPTAENKEKNRNLTSALLYRKTLPDEDGETVEIKLSELDYVGEVEARVSEAEKSETGYFLYSGGTEKELELEDQEIADYMIDYKDNQICLLVKEAASEDEEEEETGTLMLLGLADETAELKTYADDVSSLELANAGDIYYLKDLDEDAGDLYCNDERVDYEVEQHGVWALPDSSSVLYLTDYEAGDEAGTIKLAAKGKDPVEVASDVYAGSTVFTAYSDSSIFMLADYRESRGGDLLYFDGKETHTVDNDVTTYFGDGDSGIFLTVWIRKLYSGYSGSGATEADTATTAAYGW